MLSTRVARGEGICNMGSGDYPLDAGDTPLYCMKGLHVTLLSDSTETCP